MEYTHTFNEPQNQALEFDYIEKLINKLYQPGLPQDIAEAEKALQTLQRSQDGWQLADLLLQSQDANVRFFGALTFTIKINQDWQASTTRTIKAELTASLGLNKAEERALVLRKLCSALIAYHLKASGALDQCIRSIIVFFTKGILIPINRPGGQQPPISSLIKSLNRKEVKIILWFAGGLAEEVNKFSTSSMQTYKYFARISPNIGDVVDLLSHAMDLASNKDPDLAEHGMKCFQSWVMYAHRGWADNKSELQRLRPLVPLAMGSLQQQLMYDAVTELLTEILNHFPAFLTANDFRTLSTLLSADDAQRMVSRLTQGDSDEDTSSFAKLLLAYGDAAVQDLVKAPDNLQFSQVLSQLLELLKTDGYGDSEDEFCVQALEFWTTYTEFIVDSQFGNEETIPFWMDAARQRIGAVVEACWVKVRMPPDEIAVSWDSDARSSFFSFRKDVHDLLQSSFLLLGIDTLERLAQLVLQSLDDRAWLSLEASLFCLNALSDVVADDSSVDHILSKIAGSSLFADMTKAEEPIPAKTRQTAVTMVSSYTAFFERNVEHLAPMLNFLFESLRSPALANVVAKAIFSTCSSCRAMLTSELGTFLHQYEIILTWESVGTNVKEKVIGAITAIIEALPTDEDKITPLAQLIHSVEKDAIKCVQAMETSQTDKAQESGVCALRCLMSMGRALQAPEDIVINIEAEVPHSTFWTEGPGAWLQATVIGILSTITALMRSNSDIVEAACLILRSGYRENTPGLFVLPVNVTVDFVLATTPDTARLDRILDTAAVLLVSQVSKSEADLMKAASSFLVHSLGLIASMSYDPSSDPEVSTAIIDLAEKMLPRYVTSMKSASNIQLIFDFILRALTVPDVMPKRSAAQFWTTFMQKYDTVEESANFVRVAMERYGQPLCQILVTKIAGQANRSELDELARPLKRLVFTQTSARAWLSTALNSQEFPSKKVGSAEKRIWLQMIMGLRGARGTNQVVRDFWIKCRGSEFAYTL